MRNFTDYLKENKTIMRIYFFTINEQIRWTSSKERFLEYMKKDDYTYNGYMDCDGQSASTNGPSIEPCMGRNQPL